jgi:hypothetical protein
LGSPAAKADSLLDSLVVLCNGSIVIPAEAGTQPGRENARLLSSLPGSSPREPPRAQDLRPGHKRSPCRHPESDKRKDAHIRMDRTERFYENDPGRASLYGPALAPVPMGARTHEPKHFELIATAVLIRLRLKIYAAAFQRRAT